MACWTIFFAALKRRAFNAMNTSIPQFKQRMRPAPRLLWGLLCVTAVYFSVAIGFGLAEKIQWVATMERVGLAMLVGVFVVLMIDGLLLLRQPRVRIERECLGSAAVERWIEVSLHVRHNFTGARCVQLFDSVADECDYEHLPATVQLMPGQISSVRYRLRINTRGPFVLAACTVSAPSPLGLWSGVYCAGEENVIKVFPDFSAISAYTLLAADNHESQIGIRRKPRRGEGLEFLQLREYRNGDSLRKVDWKATSRRQKLISKDYQDERDQNVVLLIDGGRRMRARDDKLSHFDHSLNAMLLVSYLALRQGDSVSVMNLGSTQRWVSPQKGVAAMKNILHAMYDLQAENTASDYVGAAEKLMHLQRKRSLVILVTNSRDEDVDDLLLASQLLKQRHLVLMANIREAVIDRVQQAEVGSFDDALMYAGMARYVAARDEAQKKINRQGVYAIDCMASELAVRVANSYLEIKRSGAL